MNFFEQQDRAKRNTTWLVVLLVAAVASLIVVTTVVVVGVLFAFEEVAPAYVQIDSSGNVGMVQVLKLVDWPLIGGIALGIITVVVLGSLFKRLQLNSGGRAVAEALGGRLINVSTNDADEKRILNVVEEMAIASGTPVPPVYVLEDNAINAFAAGHSPQDAVIGITRGCIRLLNRSELQGVVAHEFSHIFHGDMRLNIRLVSMLHGILLIGLIGQMLVRSVRYRAIGRSRNSNDKSVFAMLGLGAAFMLIGYAGTFFGNIIKAAVSRQREFLADASAVQFTRDPSGIAGALRKIGGHAGGSQVEAVNAAEFSHMFFGQGVRTSLSSMMATHPPLPDRIRRLEPSWDGRFPVVQPPSPEQQQAADAPQANAQQGGAGLGGFAPLAAVAAIDAIGQPSAAHLQYAQQTLAALDDELRAAAHDSYSARGLIYGLLLHKDRNVRTEQLRLLEQNAAPEAYRALLRYAEKIDRLDERYRLPLIELALPALKELSASQYPVFKKNLGLLVRADGRVSLMEWALYRIIIHNLEDHAPPATNKQLKQCLPEAGLLLSLLAHAGQDDHEEAQAAYSAAAGTLSVRLPPLVARADASLTKLNQALATLSQLRPLQKPQLLKALARCVEHDGEITVAEAELFRAVADALDCPMPPLLSS
ncbi:M48 family metallopeptidase [Salinispirillum sp. LH 10-3-1]|uniref:M48 family metallopeptidase n=1 Tax=Salinispirillum sp. LH 10-3-1 TaxID=2952525 RepID=A0AB38YIC2_9GAMM